MDDVNTLVFANQQFSDIYECQIAAIGTKSAPNCQQPLNVKFLKALATRGIEQLKEYQLSAPFVK